MNHRLSPLFLIDHILSPCCSMKTRKNLIIIIFLVTLVTFAQILDMRSREKCYFAQDMLFLFTVPLTDSRENMKNSG